MLIKLLHRQNQSLANETLDIYILIRISIHLNTMYNVFGHKQRSKFRVQIQYYDIIMKKFQ